MTIPELNDAIQKRFASGDADQIACAVSLVAIRDIAIRRSLTEQFGEHPKRIFFEGA